MSIEAVQHIVSTPGVVGGKPRIDGRRITVQNIVIWHEQMGYSVDEIATFYDLTLAEIYSALAYYYDHKAEIDRSIEEDEAFAEALRAKTPSLLAQRLYERIESILNDLDAEREPLSPEDAAEVVAQGRKGWTWRQDNREGRPPD